MQLIPRFLRGHSENGADRSFLESYRTILFGQYQSLDNPIDNPPARAEADAVVKKGEAVTWEDLYRLELAIIKLESPDALRRRTWSVRNEYQEVASEKERADYLASNPPPADCPGETLPALRADLVNLQEELHWRYLVMWAYEDFRSNLIEIVCKLVLAVLVGFAILCWAGTDWACRAFEINLPLVLSILAAGVIGGLTSTLRRIQQNSWHGNADKDLTRLEQNNWGVYISPLLGGVFALLLLYLFMGKLMEGGLFPRVDAESLRCNGLGVMEAADYGKLLVWSFIAGFAEQFVPDNITRLVNSGAAADPVKPTPAKK